MSWCLQGLPRATRLSCSQLKASRLPLAVHPDSNRYVGRYTGLHVHAHACTALLKTTQALSQAGTRELNATIQVDHKNKDGIQAASANHRLQELHAAVAANLPVFVFHPAERYFPCTVEWFLQRCEVWLIRKGWKRRLLKVLGRRGELDGEGLKACQALFEQEPNPKQKFMQLQLDPASRAGQSDDINQVPIYAHVKEVVDPEGNLTAVEINYMKFLAFNGSYKLFDWIYIGEVGAHDGDWEHVTLRLTADAKRVLGIYYSAHRHRDGRWVSADRMPRTADGRPLSYVALNGHGAYPRTGFIPRIFLAFNDYTGKGRVWDPKQCVLVTPESVPRVVSRGSELNGSSYASAHTQIEEVGVQLKQDGAPWLAFEGRWGSTVEAPALQEWFAKAENPISRSWLAQVFFPLAPGIESIWEPFQEEVEARVQEVQQQFDDVLDDTWKSATQLRQEAEHLREKFDSASDAVKQQIRHRLHEIMQQMEKLKK